ncbi:UNVERIFIED_CONTAM: hypothetical protein Slati_3945300 [Sesamum latifolium]|uniref:Uncharacterized protein n=1 Tax=Sesamum latifolium TaxID=2727402 RepID=A0AAW2TNX1_9LAMI
MAPNRAGDNSFRGGATPWGIVHRAYNPRGRYPRAEAAGVDPPLAEVGGISVTICKA